MPLIQSSKDKAEMAQRAALIGGREGWPTPDWNKGLRRFNTYTPFFGSHSTSKDWPISGEANGRPYTTFRVSTEFSKMVFGGRRITTYYHTAIVFLDVCNGLPLFDLISKKANWEEIQRTDALWTPTGDAQFDLEITVAANAADRPQVLQFMSPQVKQAARTVLRANASARIRFGAQKSHLACWINGKDSRDGNLPPLLAALANLANAFAGAAPAQPGPMAPGPQQAPYPQSAQPAAAAQPGYPQPPQPQQQPQYAPQPYAAATPQQQYAAAAPQQYPAAAPQPQYAQAPQQYAPPPPQYPYPQQPAPGAYPQQQPMPQPMAPGYPPQPNQGPYPMQPGYPPQAAPGAYPQLPQMPSAPQAPQPPLGGQLPQMPSVPQASQAYPQQPAPGYPPQYQQYPQYPQYPQAPQQGQPHQQQPYSGQQ